MQPTWYLNIVDESTKFNDADDVIPFFPNMIDKRMVAQEGCFILFPIPKEKANFVPLEDDRFYEGDYHRLLKIYIPKSAKMEMLRDLSILGINHRTLFPDLEGLTTYISWKFKNEL